MIIQSMKSKTVFAKAMLQAARIGATRATDAATREYATKEEARWEREIAKLEAPVTITQDQRESVAA